MWGLVASVDALPKFGLAGTMGTAAQVIPIMKMAYITDFYHECRLVYSDMVSIPINPSFAATVKPVDLVIP